MIFESKYRRMALKQWNEEKEHELENILTDLNRAANGWRAWKARLTEAASLIVRRDKHP
jgi:hypothetical protein